MSEPQYVAGETCYRPEPSKCYYGPCGQIGKCVKDIPDYDPRKPIATYKEGFVKLKMPTYYIAKHSDEDLQAAVLAEREACAKLCEELRDEDGYECWGKECAVAIRTKDMFTKSQNVDTSAECVHESDKSIHEKTHTNHPMRHWDRTCPACVEEQEPVAWMYVNEDGECEQIEYGVSTVEAPYITLLYTAPPSKPWVSLTDEEIEVIAKRLVDDKTYCSLHFAVAIQAKLKEKNT